jgi:hypothetical protein
MTVHEVRMPPTTNEDTAIFGAQQWRTAMLWHAARSRELCPSRSVGVNESPLTVCMRNERCICSFCGMQTLEGAYPWRCPVRVSRPSKPLKPATQTRETLYPYVRVEGLASAGTGLASETRGLPVRITT